VALTFGNDIGVHAMLYLLLIQVHAISFYDIHISIPFTYLSRACILVLMYVAQDKDSTRNFRMQLAGRTHQCVYISNENKTALSFSFKRPLEPTVHLASARTIRQPEPMVVRPFHLAISTTMRSKAGWTMCMIVTCARAIAGLGQCEFDGEAVRERDR